MINETLHPDAEDLTTILFNIAIHDEDDRVYTALENYGAHLSDEAKADLYSLIAEQPLAEAGRVRGVAMVSRALWINQQHYPRG